MSEINNGSGTSSSKINAILSKLDKLSKQTASLTAMVNASVKQSSDMNGFNGLAKMNNQIYQKLSAENAKIKKDVDYVSIQLENIYICLTQFFTMLSSEVASIKNSMSEQTPSNINVDELAAKVAEKIKVPVAERSEVTGETVVPVAGTVDINYEELGARVVQNMHIPQAIAEDLDYEELTNRLAEKIKLTPSDDTAAVAVASEIDYEELSQKIAEKINVTPTADGVAVAPVASPVEINYEELGARVVQNMHIPQAIAEDIDYEELSKKIAEKMNIVPSDDAAATAVASEIDYEELSQKIAEKINVTPTEDGVALTSAMPEIDYEELGAKVVQNMHIPQAIAEDLDYDELSSRLAEKMNIAPADDAAVAAVANEIDYDELSEKIAEKINIASTGDGTVAAVTPAEIDYEELSNRIADKINVTPVNESVVDENTSGVARASTALRNDGETVADSQIVQTVDAENLDYDQLAKKISEKLILAQALGGAAVAGVGLGVGALASKSDGSGDGIVIDYEELGAKVVQNMHIPQAIAEDIDYDELTTRLAEKINIAPTGDGAVAAVAPAEIDYEELSDRIAGKINVTPADDAAVAAVANEIDYDELSEKIAEKINIASTGDGTVAAVTPAEIDYEELSNRIADKINVTPVNESVVDENTSGVARASTALRNDGEAVADSQIVQTVDAENLDYDQLAKKISEKLILAQALGGAAVAGVGLGVGALASKSDGSGDGIVIDYEQLGAKVVQNMHIPQAIAEDIDYDELTTRLADKLGSSETFKGIAVAGVGTSSDDGLAIDYEQLGAQVVQNMHIPQAIAEDIDYDVLSSKLAEKLDLQQISGGMNVAGLGVASRSASVSVDDLDIDALAAKLSSAMPVQEVISPDYIASKVAEQIIIPEYAVAPEIDVEEITGKVAEKLASGGEGAGLDIEELSRKVADKIALPAFDDVKVDEDAIASAVVEKLKESEVEVGEDGETVEANNAFVDEHVLAEDIASRLNFSLSDELIAAAVVKNLTNVIDNDEIADCVAKKVGTISPEQFDVMVDDDGCDSLAKAVQEKLDYDAIASVIAEKVNPALIASSDGDIDAEELAKTLSERLSLTATVDEDAIADKAAAVLSNYLPEIDTDDIADKVVAGVIPAIPSAPIIDYEGISSSVSDRIVESQEDREFDIVIDDDGLSRITENVSSEIKEEYEKRFDKIDGDIKEIKKLLLTGVVVSGVSEIASTAVIREAIENDEDLVTVSDIVDETEEETDEEEELIDETIVDEEAEEETEETADEEADEETEETVDEEAEETADEETEETADEESDEETEEAADEETEETVDEEADEETEETVDEESDEETEETADEDVDEEDEDGQSVNNIDVDIDAVNVAAGEGDAVGLVGGVDFTTMMRYKRSFISRIIQSTDEQKRYYGQVKTALNSYKKVNSYIAWGAERFQKGRETIARLKIRGKTLCLYLALDPNEFKTSVYHQIDVSENKSVQGTPMMVRIKSPLGVKKAIRLINIMLEQRNGIKQNVAERDFAKMYPYETMEELIEEGLIKDVRKTVKK